MVEAALRRPVTLVMVLIGLVAAGIFSLDGMPRDILPNLDSPIIYLAQPYGGMDPAQMESYITYYYEYHFLYIDGIQSVESKNIQSVALIKLQFYPGTDMSDALAETINYVNRAQAYMPPGVLAPFVMRFDAGSEAVGDLVFSSQTRGLGDIQNLALNNVRPLLATLPGISVPPPFGVSNRTIVINVDPQKLRKFNLSPYDVAEALGKTNKVIPSGNIKLGSLYPSVPLNSVVTDIQQLAQVPIRIGTDPTVSIGDVATVEDSTDIQYGYALVEGKRAVYIPVTKRATASTLAVVDLVKKNMAKFQAVLPSDVSIRYEFDQSHAVRDAIGSLVLEGILGAFLTGFMVFLFLGDIRSTLVVLINIPLALVSALIALALSHQTVNIMTLGGLALAIGILVDETTVSIENIHSHLARGKPVARACLDAIKEITIPCFLTVLCVLAVFTPSFFMSGASRALFVPLTLAVGFSMIASFILSQTLVPVLAVWLLKNGTHAAQTNGVHRGGRILESFRYRYLKLLNRLIPNRRRVVVAYLLAASLCVAILSVSLGREIFPLVNWGQMQIRLRAPAGTIIDETEKRALQALHIIERDVGPQNVESSIGFVGLQPPSYPMNAIYLWTSGPQDGVLQVEFRPGVVPDLERLKERLRQQFRSEIPDTEIGFEASGLIERTMGQGSSTPIEVAVSGPHFAETEEYAKAIRSQLEGLRFLRDLQIAEVFNYPEISVDVERRRAGLLGLTIESIGRSLATSTYSSRYVLRNYWADYQNGTNYQVQVEVPQAEMSSIDAIQNIPIAINGGAVPLKTVADIHEGTRPGEYDRYNMQRTVTLTANLHDIDLGHASRVIGQMLNKQKSPKGVDVTFRGQVPAMNTLLQGLLWGLIVAVGVIFLILSANFESLSLALVILSTVPAALAGSMLLLWLTGTTLNIESFMGMIMAIGVAVANAILLVTFAEQERRTGQDATVAAVHGANSRLRPILMTSLAMLAGMIPMAVGWSGGGEASPLGRAVIGGLSAATIATLFVLPLLYSVVQERRTIQSTSLHPLDPESILYEKS